MSADSLGYDPNKLFSENNKPKRTMKIINDDDNVHVFYKVGHEYEDVDKQGRLVHRIILAKNKVNNALALGPITKIRIPLSKLPKKDYNIGEEYVYKDPDSGTVSTHVILREHHHLIEGGIPSPTPTHIELGPRLNTRFGGGKRRRRRKSRSKSRKSRRKSRKTKRKRRKSRKTKKRRRRRR